MSDTSQDPLAYVPLVVDPVARETQEHAWRWFVLHANQRMQTFNYFLVATAFLFSAYGSLLKEYRPAAVVVALLGAWLAFWFRRMDVRTRQLIDVGRQGMIATQARLARRAELPEIELAQAAGQCAPGGSTYSRVIDVVHWTIVVVFVAAAGYALSLPLTAAPPH